MALPTTAAWLLMGTTLLAQPAPPQGAPTPQSKPYASAQRSSSPAPAWPTAKSARAEYARRSGRLAEDDTKARVALAQWCRTNGLFTEMKREATRAVRRDPDNESARTLLGQVRKGQRWEADARAMRARGYVLYRDTWVRKYDAERLQYRRDAERKRRELERTLNRHFRGLWSRSERKRAASLEALTALADRREWPALDKLARQHHAAAVRYIRETATVYATVRAQKTDLLGLTPVTTSLGVGTPVTIQLPQTRSISVGTTVAIPAGRD